MKLVIFARTEQQQNYLKEEKFIKLIKNGILIFGCLLYCCTNRRCISHLLCYISYHKFWWIEDRVSVKQIKLKCGYSYTAILYYFNYSYKNPIDSCNSLNPLVLPEYLLHIIITVFFLVAGEWISVCLVILKIAALKKIFRDLHIIIIIFTSNMTIMFT